MRVPEKLLDALADSAERRRRRRRQYKYNIISRQEDRKWSPHAYHGSWSNTTTAAPSCMPGRAARQNSKGRPSDIILPRGLRVGSGVGRHDMVVGERDANSPKLPLTLMTPTTYKTLPFRIHDDLYELIVPRLTHVSTSLLLLTVRHPPSSGRISVRCFDVAVCGLWRSVLYEKARERQILIKVFKKLLKRRFAQRTYLAAS